MRGEPNLTKNKAKQATTYKFAANKPVHIDANILFFMHPPLGRNQPEAAVYAPVIQTALQQSAKLRVSVLVVSEYINTYARYVYNSLYKKTYPNFKKFRSSHHWTPYAGQIEGEVKAILSYCEVTDALSDNSETLQHMQQFSSGSFDFNDQLIVRTCQLDSAALLTHDGDMTSGGIDVITENLSLLAKCP